MAVNTGERETGFDTQLVRDANGLPMIPATSIAGVWRQLVHSRLGEDIAQHWFGSLGEASSCISISNATVNDSSNKNINGLQTRQSLQQDPLLRLLLEEQPFHRDRVSINDRGVATDKGKFDQILLPTGIRFTLDFSWDDQRPHPNQALWKKVLSFWQDRQFALGSTTRNGLGRFELIASDSQCIDLSKGPSAGQALEQFRRNETPPNKVDLSFEGETSLKPFASLPIKALDNWRCGSGSELLDDRNRLDQGKISLMTYTESPIIWQNKRGELSQKEVPVLCGSSIKGILAHRLAFHFRKHKGIWAEDMAELSHVQWQQRPIELKELLGQAADDKKQAKSGCVGKLYIDDSEIHYTNTIIRHHNSIDRFTGGVRKGARYSEELLYQPEFTLQLWLAPETQVSVELKDALNDTLNDLKTGLLPMGAGSGRGTSLVKHNTEQPWEVDWSLMRITGNTNKMTSDIDSDKEANQA
jgi:CRISPR/Cas system CMR subunit Cmr4 (Cas7 group RAMP superfamily)